MSKPLSPDRAAWYFQRDNYYLTETGEWHGRLSEELQLNGAIQRDDFLKLLEGFDQNGNKLVASAGAKDIKDGDGKIIKHGHRSGIDLTFSAPKSVSILSYHDPRINNAFKEALKTTLNHIEQEFAHTQTKDRSGVVHAEKTNKLLWSTFVHDTSRELDPQLHCHCVLMNLTQNSAGKFKTLHNDPLYKNKMYLGQHFRTQLAQEIQKLGYSIEVSDRKKGFFEVKGIGNDVMEAFSKRSKQVQEEVKKLRKLEFKDLPSDHLLEWAKERKKEFSSNPDFNEIVSQEAERLSNSSEKVYSSYGDAELASIAVTERRRPKRDDITREQVISRIEDTCKSFNTSLEGLFKSSIEQPKIVDPKPLAREILNDAVSGLTEGQSTFTRHILLTEAMKMGIGSLSFDDLNKEFRRMLKDGSISLLGSIETKAGQKDIFSSRSMIEVENNVIKMCREAKGASTINVDKSLTDSFITHTDINLKMKAALELGEKDPIKAEYKFKSVLAKIDDPLVRDKMISLREQAIKSKHDTSVSPVDAADHPELHQYFEKFGYGFTPGQRDALRLISSTKDVFSVIQGDAGTGKSFSVLYAKQLLEQNGFIVKGFAPTGKATTGLAVSAEIFESNYSTIDSFLLRFKNADSERRKEMYSKGKEIWVVDEAGMCGSRKFLDLMTAAREAEAKVVFIGDRKQFQSIEAGRMFSDLQDRSGIDMVIMPDVMRQKTAQTKEIVRAISLKDMDFAFNVMQGFKKVSPGFDKTDIANYSIGSSIQFTAGYKGISADTQCKVLGIGERGLDLEYFDEDSRSFRHLNFNPSEIDKAAFDVYRPPLNHHSLSKFNVGDTLSLSISEQGIPATSVKIKEISEKSLTVTYSDVNGQTRKATFDPTKNPENLVHYTSSGNEKTANAKDIYENMITVESDHDKCLNLVAQDYLSSIAARKDVLLITGTNKDKDSLNQIIRPDLVKQGLVTDSKEFTVFQTKSLAGTGAMAADSYKTSQVIITNNSCGQVPKGTQAEILSIDKTANTINVRFWDKKKEMYTTADIDVRKHCKSFSTYDQQKKEFGVGDLILFLKNDKKTVGVNNGDTARILSIDSEGNVKARLESTEDKKEVTFNISNKGSKAYNYVSHAYAITDYKSQGATTGRLLWFAPAHGGPISSNTFYVAITRCKEEVGVYTDDVDKLREMVKQDQHKESVLDFTMQESKSSEIQSKQPIEEPYKSPFSFKETIESVKELYHKHVSSIFSPKEDKPKSKEIESVSIDV